MPSYGVYFPEDEAPQVEAAVKASGQKVALYIADAVRQRMKSEGHIPGTPAHDLRAELDTVISVVRDNPRKAERLLSMLQEFRTDEYSSASEAAGGGK
jgi:hypothetical protein